MYNELESIRKRLLAYIESAYHLSDPQLVGLRRELLEQPEVLCHSPFIESSARYAIGKPYSELSIPAEAEQLLSFLATEAGGKVVFPQPYEHQAQALAGQRHFVVWGVVFHGLFPSTDLIPSGSIPMAW